MTAGSKTGMVKQDAALSLLAHLHAYRVRESDSQQEPLERGPAWNDALRSTTYFILGGSKSIL